jgi:hypothetical protein
MKFTKGDLVKMKHRIWKDEPQPDYELVLITNIRVNPANLRHIYDFLCLNRHYGEQADWHYHTFIDSNFEKID